MMPQGELHKRYRQVTDRAAEAIRQELARRGQQLDSDVTAYDDARMILALMERLKLPAPLLVPQRHEHLVRLVGAPPEELLKAFDDVFSEDPPPCA